MGLLVASGCSVKVVQHFLRHATATETLGAYRQLWPDDDDRITGAIDDVLRTGSVDPDVSRSAVR